MAGRAEGAQVIHCRPPMSNPTHISSFYAAILFQARVNPFSTAVSIENREITYRAFCADIEKVTRRLHRLGLPAGARVGVHIHHLYLRWLAIIALARMGMVSVSVSSPEPTRELEFLNPHLVLTDRPGSVSGRTAVEAGPHWVGDEADSWPLVRCKRQATVVHFAGLRFVCLLQINPGAVIRMAARARRAGGGQAWQGSTHRPTGRTAG